MNKGLRQYITKLKHKKRCAVWGLNPKEHYCYKEQSIPCSCVGCVGKKYSRKLKHKDIWLRK